MTTHRGTWGEPAALALGYAMLVVLAWPAGNFPLNDDWSYASAALGLAQEGVFRPTGWTGMPLVAQAAWGAVFVRILGSSYEVLRLSTAVLAIVAALSLWSLARNLSPGKGLALLCAGLLVANPIAFALSATFMTDVPFLAFALLAVLSLSRYLETSRTSWLLAGTLAAIAATLTRQLGLFVPLAFAATSVIAARGAPWRRMLAGVIPLAAAACALLLFEGWLSRQGLPAMYRVASDDLRRSVLAGPGVFLPRAAGRLLVVLGYVGPFLLPVVVAVLPGRFVNASPRARALAIASSLAVLLAFVAGRATGSIQEPRPGNMLWDIGLGPPTLVDVFFGYRSLPSLPGLVRTALLALAALGAAGLVGTLLLSAASLIRHRGATSPNGSVVAFVTLAAAIYLGPLLLPEEAFFDRYCLPLVALLPLLLVAGTSGETPPVRTAAVSAVAALTALALFAAAGTHDWFAWNRARWDALRQLVQDRQVPPSRIDGGFEFNGAFLYAPDYEMRPDRAWWWVHDPEWVLAFGPLPGYQVESRWPHARWLGGSGRGEVLVLRRQPRGGGTPAP